MLVLKDKQALTLAYFKEFKCVGGACADNCCKDWRVDIDKNTYLAYRTAFKKNPALQEKAEKFVKRNKKAMTNFSYATITMKEDRNCPFLAEGGLCEIQLDSGYGLLSHVCKTYPRIATVVDGRFELSMTVSCIEVLRKVLFDKNSTQLKRQSVTCDCSEGFSLNTATADPASILAHYWSVRAFSFEVLQNSNYSFEHKLAFLGIAYSKLSAMEKAGELDGVNSYLDVLLKAINAGEIDITSLALDNKLLKFQLTEALLESVITSKGIRIPALVVAVLKAVHGLLNKNDPDAERDYAAIVGNYEKSLDTYYKPWAKENGHMVDNFFFNEFFRQAIPFNVPGDIWKSYTQFCAIFAIFRYIFAGVALQAGGMSDDDALQIFLGVSKGLQHASELFLVFTEALEKAEMNTLPHMVLLIS